MYELQLKGKVGTGDHNVSHHYDIRLHIYLFIYSLSLSPRI